LSARISKVCLYAELFLLFPALFPAALDRKGVLTVDGVQHEVILQDLPAVVESYKTLDDANLVKVTDIGQVRLISASGVVCVCVGGGGAHKLKHKLLTWSTLGGNTLLNHNAVRTAASAW
jgi:TATA-binding protein-associated factor Taf7